MDPEIQETLRAAEQAVKQVLDVCRKNRPLYTRHTRPVAQVNRTAKWLLNAIESLRRAINTAEESEDSEGR